MTLPETSIQHARIKFSGQILLSFMSALDNNYTLPQTHSQWLLLTSKSSVAEKANLLNKVGVQNHLVFLGSQVIRDDKSCWV